MPAALALTFDDGPDPRGTPAVLEALAAAGVRATFFVLGERVRAHPGLLSAVLEAGHAVEVHGYGHLSHRASGRAAVAADLERALEALDAAAVRPARWRVPWGFPAPFSAGLARERDLTLTGWTLDTHDWAGHPPAAMLAALTPDLRPGDVVLMHDGIGPGAEREHARETAALVAPLVAAARRGGLAPGPLTPGWPVPEGNPDDSRAARPGRQEPRDADRRAARPGRQELRDADRRATTPAHGRFSRG